MKQNKPHKSGYTAIIGLPNAGKSTLLNAILGTKLSIITPKPQTTRHRISGIYSDDDSQIIFLDTPGIIRPRYKLQETMMSAVDRARRDADLIVHLIDPENAEINEDILSILKKSPQPVIMVVNKIDLIKDKSPQPVIEAWKKEREYEHIAEVSALYGKGIKELVALIKDRMPEGPAFYPKDQLSDHPGRFFIEEIIREKLFVQYQQELPYSCAVIIIEYNETDTIDHIDTEIVVNRNSQKGIIIGKGGDAIKKLGSDARVDIEEFLGKQVNLKLFVKVREKWRDKDIFLKNYGY